MRRILLFTLLLFSVVSVYAQSSFDTYHPKEVTDSLMQDYVGIWRYQDTVNMLEFTVEFVTRDVGDTYALNGRYSLKKNGEYITNEFNNPNILQSKEASISGLLFKRKDFIDFSFKDRGNKNRLAGSEEWGDKCSYLKAYQENGIWYMQWHIMPEEAKLYFVESEDDIPGDFWTVPEDCILEKVE